MLRPKLVIGQRSVAAIVAPLAFALSMGISHQALAACSPAGSPPGDTYTTDEAAVTCDAADDEVTVGSGGQLDSLSTDGGADEVTVQTGGAVGDAIVNGNVTTGGGADAVEVEGGTVFGNVNTGNDGDTVEVEDDGTVTGNVSTGAGDDGVTINGGEVGGSVTTDEGEDSVTITDGEVGGNVNTGDNNDIVTVNDEGEIEGNVNTGTGDDVVTVNSGGEIEGNLVTDGGADAVTINNGGEVGGNIEMGQDADVLQIFGGEVGGDITTAGGADQVFIDLSGGGALGLEGAFLNTGAGADVVELIGLSNIEEDEGNLEIENEDFALVGGAGYDVLLSDDNELRFGDIDEFEFLRVEESILVLTGDNYVFSPAGASSPPDRGIAIDGSSQVWFTNAATVEAPHIAIEGPSGDATLKVSNQYAAFDPGGMLMFGAYPAEGGDDDDDEAEPGEPVDVTVNIGPNTVVNAGTMGTLNGIAGDTVTVIGGGYESQNGNFVIDTQLGDSNSPTDRFNFDPSQPVDGLTTIYVNNAGGKGGFTGHGATDGIVIVSGPAGFGPTGSFQLGVNLTGRREVLAGAFSYQLVTSGTTARLQSDVLDQVPAYTVASSASQRFASTGLGTLYKRLGEVRLGHANDQALAGGGSMWARGLYGDYDVDPQQGYGFSQKTDGVLMGVDAAVASNGGGKWLFGLFGGYGSSDVDVTTTIWGQNSASKLDLTGWTAGGYGTYWENGRPGTGYYFDGVIKADILDYDMTSVARSTSASTDGYAGTISGETGYGFAFGGNLTLQPQAQLSYTTVSITNYTDSYGIKVGNGAAESLMGRASLQLQGNYGSGNSGWFAPYVIASVLSEFLGGNETVVGGTPFQSDMGLTWFEAGGGVTAELSNSISLYGSAEYSFGDVEGWGGTGGVRARW